MSEETKPKAVRKRKAKTTVAKETKIVAKAAPKKKAAPAKKKKKSTTKTTELKPVVGRKIPKFYSSEQFLEALEQHCGHETITKLRQVYGAFSGNNVGNLIKLSIETIHHDAETKRYIDANVVSAKDAQPGDIVRIGDIGVPGYCESNLPGVLHRINEVPEEHCFFRRLLGRIFKSDK